VGSKLTDNGWSAHSGSGTAPISVTTGLSFDGYAGSDIGGAAAVNNNGEDLNKQLAQTVTSDTVYTAFLFNAESSNAAGYFMHLLQAGSTSVFASRLFISAKGDTISIVETGSTAPTASTAKLGITPGATQLGVVEFVMSTKKSNLYVFSEFPTAKPSTGFATSTDAASVASIGAVALRQYNAAQRVTVDGIRVARSWGEAVKAGLTAPPAFVGSSAVDNASLTSTVANIGAKVNQNAQLFYTVKTSPQPAIAAAQVVAEAADSISVLANASATIALSGLLPATQYYVYLVAKNARGLSEVDTATFATLSATAPVLVVSPQSLAFDTVVGLTQSRSFTVEAANLSAPATITLSGSGAFALSAASADNGSTTITVTYTAGNAAVDDTVWIRANGIERTLALSGTPRIPALTVSNASLDFATVVGTPMSKIVVVRGSNLKGDIAVANAGTAFTLSKTTLSAAKAQAAAGDTLTVTFNALAAATDTIVLTAADAVSVKIALDGTVRNKYDNMLANPSFEIWTNATGAPDSWTIASGSSKETSIVKHGLNAAKITTSTATISTIQYVNGVEPGKHYTISFWYYIDTVSTGNGIRIWSQFRTGTTNIVAANDPNLALIQPSAYGNAKGLWVQHVIDDYVAPANADNFRFEVRTYANASSRTVAYLDQFFFGEKDLTAPSISLTPSSLAFDAVALGNTSTDTLTITSANITGSLSLSISGTHAAYFTAPTTAASGTTKVVLSYQPTAAGNHSATLTVSGGGITREVALSGTGVDIATVVITPISAICTGASESPYNGQTLTIAGTVSAKTAANNFFVQDGSGANHGIYVYRYGTQLSVGDSVLVKGVVSEYHGLTEISVAAEADIVVIANGKTPPAATTITLAQLGKSYHSTLISLANLQVKTILSDTKYVVSSGADTLVVAADIYNSIAAVKVGDMVNITGLGFAYDLHQILPRSAADVVVHSVVPPTTYTVTIAAATNGSISVLANGAAVASGSALPQGTALTIAATPSTGYVTATLTVNGTAHPSGSTHTLAANITVAATFSKSATAVSAVEAKDVLLYPNPVSSILYVQAPLPIAKICVRTLAGVALREVLATTAIDLTDLPAGMYIVTLTFGNGETLSKIVAK
jgi:DNA/RNA endonuclease YhcR with UshA esterase domain